MAIKPQQGQQTQQQMQQQLQQSGASSASPSQRQMQQQATPQPIREAPPGANPAAWPFVDPLGRPMHQTSPRFTDQQAGGDLTGDESDARDDNYVVTGSGQNARDVSAHAEKLPAVSAELLRSAAIAPAGGVKTRPPLSEQAPEQASKQAATEQVHEPEPDGTEDPGANADDGLMPRKKDGTADEQH